MLVAGDEASSSVSLFRLLDWEKPPDLQDKAQIRTTDFFFKLLSRFHTVLMGYI